MNKVTITINSRQYNVIAEESEEYLTALGEHINEKVDKVIKSGTNVMGERPLVLAALNVCDEYFKAYEAGYTIEEKLKSCSEKLKEQSEENKSLKEQINRLNAELDDAKSGQVTMEETESAARSADLEKQLDEARSKITFLEGQIKLMEDKQKSMKQEFAAREQEILDLIDKQ